MALITKVFGSVLGVAGGLMIVLGPSMKFDRIDSKPLDESEPLRMVRTTFGRFSQCSRSRWVSLLLHPMLEIQLRRTGDRGICDNRFGGAQLHCDEASEPRRGGDCLDILDSYAILFHLYHPPFELWRRIAGEVVAGNSPSQTVFFEAGYVIGIRQATALNPDSLVEVLPNGYLRILFDYYFCRTQSATRAESISSGTRSRGDCEIGVPRRRCVARESSN